MPYRNATDPSEVLVFFKTDLRDTADRASTEALDERMNALVSSMDGFLSIKPYAAGEHPEHRKAQRRGREEFHKRC